MNKFNSQFEKSKSINSAVTNKSDTSRNAKKPNICVKPLVKKRGVYVENKSTELSIKANMDRKSKAVKHLPRPGKKQFLDSVFDILSKSTAGTQYTDNDVITNSEKVKIGKNKKYGNNTDEKINAPKKKPKYKSKILNDNKNLESQFVVLKSNKNISDSASTYSEKSRDPEIVRWSDFLPPLIHRKDSSRTEFAASKDREPTKQKRVTLADDKEPATLIGSETKNDDKKLYKFFVDVLQTTLGDCKEDTLVNNNADNKIKADNVTCAKCPIIDFEMDESLEKNIEDYNESNHDFNRFLCTPHDYEINQYNSGKFKRKLFNYNVLSPTTNTIKTRRKLKSESFLYNKKTPIPFTNNLIFQKSPSRYKKSIKKEYKTNFLNILKNELQMDNDFYETPQNLYQALKTMARKKRCHERTISFKEPTKGDEDDGKCVFKRRRVLSSRPKLKKKPIQQESSRSVIVHSYDRVAYGSKKITDQSKFESTHSILVYGYDYQKPKKNREHVKTRENSPSKFDDDISPSKYDEDNSPSRSELIDEDSLYFSNSSITVYSVKK